MYDCIGLTGIVTYSSCFVRTFAFLWFSVIPTLSQLKQPSTKGIRALLLAPTKELAEQIHREVQRLIEGRRFKVCLLSKKISGKAITSQVSGLAKRLAYYSP